MSGLDCTDQAIVEALRRDARSSSAEISRKTGIPKRTVHHRLRRLLESQMVKTAVIIDHHAFGYSLAVDIFCELEPGYMTQAVELLLRMPEISYLALSTGDQDISLQALFKTIDEMQAFITHKLHPIPGMRRTRTVLIPQILKDTYEWRPPLDCPESAKAGESAGAGRSAGG